MSETMVRRRGHGEDGIYLDAARNRYMGAVSLGFGPDGKRIRKKVSGQTRQEAHDKLKALHQELNAGVKSSRTCTVGTGQARDPLLHRSLQIVRNCLERAIRQLALPRELTRPAAHREQVPRPQ
jgi:hypothetical protein